MLGEVEGSGGVVAPRAGNDLHPVVNPLDAEGHGGDVLPDREGGALAGGSADTDGIHAVVELLVDQAAEAAVINGAALVKGVTMAVQAPVKTGSRIRWGLPPLDIPPRREAQQGEPHRRPRRGGCCGTDRRTCNRTGCRDAAGRCTAMPPSVIRSSRVWGRSGSSK